MRRSLAVAIALVAAACAPSNSQTTPPAEQKPAAPGAAPAASPGAQPSGAAAQPPAPSDPAASAPASATPPASTAPPAPTTPPAPTAREVIIPEGTVLSVRLTTPIASDTSKVEDVVTGTLSKPIAVREESVIPAGADVAGAVLSAKGSGRVKGRASLVFRFNRLEAYGERHQIQTARISREAAADTKGDVTKGGIGAGAGAIIGGIAGGGKGAVIGGAIGGAGAVMATKGKEVRFAAGDVVTTKLTQPLKILVPISR